jgi:predicted nucleic acid-binding protein
MVVADATVIVDVLLGAPRSATARRHLREQAPVHAPHLIDVEVLHALRRWTREGRVTADAAQARLARFETLMPLTRHPHRELWLRTWELRNRLSAYDATYVALAEVLEAPLLTADARLGRGAEGLVEIILVA